MAKKTYKTYFLKGLQLLLFDEQGRTIEINFKGGLQVDSTAKFSTSDEKLQNAIEQCSGFNRDFYLDSVREDAPADAAPVKAVAEVPVGQEENEATVPDDADDQVVNVSCKADAVEWLKEHYPEKGYNGSNLRSKEAFENACKDCGVTFDFSE